MARKAKSQEIILDEKEKRLSEIVKSAQALYAKQLKKSAGDGFHHPILHSSTKRINELIAEFEELSGKDWDKEASKYLTK